MTGNVGFRSQCLFILPTTIRMTALCVWGGELQRWDVAGRLTVRCTILEKRDSWELPAEKFRELTRVVSPGTSGAATDGAIRAVGMASMK